MYSLYYSYSNFEGSGDLNPGPKLKPGYNNSGLIKTFKYVALVLLSQSSVIWPPYIISPKIYFKSSQGTTSYLDK